MPSLGNVTVGLRASSGQFTKTFKKARRTMFRFARAMDHVNGALKLVGKITRMISGPLTDAAKSMDALGKSSARIGTSTEALIALQHAADQTGSSGEKLLKAFDVLQKRLGEAAAGTGQARKSLDALGISASELLAMDPADAFARIADGIAGLGSQAEKAAATSNLFSRANQDLLNLLQGGSQTIRSYRDEAERLGLLYSADQAKLIERMNDAWDRVRKVFSGLSTSVMAELAPSLTELATLIERMSTSDGVPLLTSALRGLVDVMKFVTLSFYGWSQILTSIDEKIADGAIAEFLGRAAYVRNVEEMMRVEAERIKKMNAAQDELVAMYTEQGMLTERSVSWTYKAAEAYDAVRSAIASAVREADRYADAVTLGSGEVLGEGGLASLRGPAGYTEEMAKRRERSMRIQAMIQADLAKNAERTVFWYDRWGQAADRVAERMAFVREIGQQVVLSFSSQLVDAMWEVQAGTKSWGEALEDISRSILRMVTQMAVQRAVMSAMGMPVVASANGNVVDNGRLQRFASGGVVNGPTVFPMRNGAGLMGEAGPEAIMPLTRRGGKLGVEGAAVVNIHNYSGSDAQVTERDSQGRRTIDVVIGEVGRSMQSGQLSQVLSGTYGLRRNTRPTG